MSTNDEARQLLRITKGDTVQITEIGCSCGWRFNPANHDTTMENANAQLARHLADDAPHRACPHATFITFEE